MPVGKISRLMGHSSTAVTERVYVHLVFDSDEAVRALMDAYMQAKAA